MEKENQLLINKYKPIILNDFIGNKDVTTFLNKIICLNSFPFVLIGPPGTGKTSYLEAFVNEYFKTYNITCNSDNILFINQLKEQGINYFKNDVKNFCQTKSKVKNIKKIVILDNLDCLHESSQYLIRYLMDTYSHQILFIASACSQQKLIPPLQSRFLSHKINYPSYQELVVLSKLIIQKENILIHSDDIINKIVIRSNNSFRKLINILDKCRILGKELDENLIYQLCSDINYKLYENIIHLLQRHEIALAIKSIQQITDMGYSNIDIYDNFYNYIKITDLSENIKLQLIPIICVAISNFYNFYEDPFELILFVNHLYKILR